MISQETMFKLVEVQLNLSHYSHTWCVFVHESQEAVDWSIYARELLHWFPPDNVKGLAFALVRLVLNGPGIIIPLIPFLVFDCLLQSLSGLQKPLKTHEGRAKASVACMYNYLESKNGFKMIIAFHLTQAGIQRSFVIQCLGCHCWFGQDQQMKGKDGPGCMRTSSECSLKIALLLWWLEMKLTAIDPSSSTLQPMSLCQCPRAAGQEGEQLKTPSSTMVSLSPTEVQRLYRLQHCLWWQQAPA